MSEEGRNKADSVPPPWVWHFTLEMGVALHPGDGHSASRKKNVVPMIVTASSSVGSSNRQGQIKVSSACGPGPWKDSSNGVLAIHMVDSVLVCSNTHGR